MLFIKRQYVALPYKMLEDFSNRCKRGKRIKPFFFSIIEPQDLKGKQIRKGNACGPLVYASFFPFSFQHNRHRGAEVFYGTIIISFVSPRFLVPHIL